MKKHPYIAKETDSKEDERQRRFEERYNRNPLTTRAGND